jgi:hypothetical protein
VSGYSLIYSQITLVLDESIALLESVRGHFAVNCPGSQFQM